MLTPALRRRRIIFWRRLTASAVVLFPLSLSHVDFRSVVQSGLSISTNKASPAYAAFEDLRENFDSPEFEIPDHGQRLASGTAVDMSWTRQVVQQRVVAMRGLTIRAESEFHPEKAPGAEKNMMVAAHTVAPQVAVVPSLPNAASQPSMSADDFAAVTPAQRALELVEQELQASQVANAPMLIAQYQKEQQGKDEKLVPDLSTFVPNRDFQRPLWLNGQIEMTGGLAFVGPETHIEVKRVVNGETLERGRIWVTEGKFEIHVKKPSGYLVAELQTRDGRVIGRGEMNLLHLTEIPRKDNRVHDIRLALRPTADGASFRTVSGYSHGNQKMAVAGARVEIQAYTEPQGVDDEGFVTEPSLNKDSSFVARAVATQHWPTLVVGQAHHPQDIRLFSNSLVDALINLENANSMDRKEAHHASIVWGQLTRDGSPVEGGQLEMAGEYQAIYFNDLYLPDRNMKGTGRNGLFAFLKVKAGVQALRANVNGRLYPAQIFPTENKHVSYVELEVRNKVVSQFRVFDVLNMDAPVQAHIKLVGTDAVLQLNKNQYVEYSVASGHYMIEADGGGDYEISRMTMTGTPHLVNVPLVKREFIHQLLLHKNPGTIPGRGMIVGFIDDQDFEVELTGYAPQEQMQILYFDSEGKPLDSKMGAAGGGFIIFNAPSGVQTIYIHPRQSRETYSQVVVAEPHYVHVVAWAAAVSKN